MDLREHDIRGGPLGLMFRAGGFKPTRDTSEIYVEGSQRCLSPNLFSKGGS